ncbi:hypothetical protein F5B22DRAFT_584660 [Xylaria bambusicola]|uniref:uncharacterized protein n=1 Tax=Xylaria bambusicola TaxID=326684 RepID=UPI002007C6E0|nr:uncharacterized protein F5B22DRAFT_584660 [Xylaria bambusicola]KAI0526156.1 hypothetical protein F5B22DRAFT_584660 [Xylaria bambusicola]
MKFQLAITLLAALYQQAGATQLKAYSFQGSCGGTPDFIWQDAGSGCIEFHDNNGLEDMYSLYWAGPSCSFSLFAGPGCSGQSEPRTVDHACMNRGGKSIKSVYKYC